MSNAMASRWADRFDAWLHPRERARAGTFEAYARRMLAEPLSLVDVQALMARLGIQC